MPDQFVSENLLCYWEHGSETCCAWQERLVFLGFGMVIMCFVRGTKPAISGTYCKFENIYRDSIKN